MSDHYTYRITWSAEDNEHVGLCAEFPSLSWLGPYARCGVVRHPAPCARVSRRYAYHRRSRAGANSGP